MGQRWRLVTWCHAEQLNVFQVSDFVGDISTLKAEAAALAQRCCATEWNSAAGEDLQLQLFDLDANLLRDVLRCMLEAQSLDSLLHSLPMTLHEQLLHTTAHEDEDGLHLYLGVRMPEVAPCADLINQRMAHAPLLFAKLPYLNHVVSVDLQNNQMANIELADGLRVRFALVLCCECICAAAHPGLYHAAPAFALHILLHVASSDSLFACPDLQHTVYSHV